MDIWFVQPALLSSSAGQIVTDVQYESVLVGINFLLILVLSHRLWVRRTGVLSPGGMGVWTAIFPIAVGYPLYRIVLSPEPGGNGTIADALILLAIVSASLCLGTFVWTPTVWLRRSVDRTGAIPAGARYAGAVVILGLVALLGTFQVFTRKWNPIALLPGARSAEFRSIYAEGVIAYPILLSTALVKFGVALYIAFVAHRAMSNDRSWRIRATIRCTLVAAVASLVLLALGSRAAAFWPLLMLAVTYGLYARRGRQISRLALVCAVALVPAFVAIRLLSSGVPVHDIVDVQRADGSFVVDEFAARMSGIEGYQDYLEWEQDEPYEAGATLPWVVLRWVPRQLLENKRSTVDVELSHAIYGRQPGGGGVVLFGGIGEMHWNFGYAGLALWFAMVGGVMRGVQRCFLLRSVLPPVWVALVVSNDVLLRGWVNVGVNTSGTQQMLSIFIVQGAVLLGLVLLATHNKRERGEAEAPVPAHVASPNPLRSDAIGRRVASHAGALDD